jgi:hypothetical protein
MHKLIYLIAALAAVVSTLAEETNLVLQLEPLRPFIGRTWKGQFPRSTPEKPVYDISRWERALNGQAIRITHSVNDGAYGGETIIRWDASAEKIQYHYFTTAGFMTKGTMTIENDKLLCEEEPIPAFNGITRIKAVMRKVDGKKMHVKSEHLKDGSWTPGHEIMYEEAPDAKVVFK